DRRRRHGQRDQPPRQRAPGSRRRRLQVMSRTAETRYAALVETGTLDFDPAQADLARRLADLAGSLEERPPSLLARLFGRRSAPPRGLYVHGDVGRGKTMLVDLFFETVGGEAKRRAHF